MRLRIFFLFIFLIFRQLSFSQNSNRVITTGVPFLLITSDARAAGMNQLSVGLGKKCAEQVVQSLGQPHAASMVAGDS